MTFPAPALQVSPKQARAERARRELARRNFAAYCAYVDARFEPQPHVKLLADKLQQVGQFIASGGRQGIGRLMIFMPPQHGKSTLASRHFPAWLLGWQPDVRIILSSYGESLATGHSRFIRDQLTTAEYQAVFGISSSVMKPVELSSDSRSVESWDLAHPHRGGVKAAGVGGGITGLPAHLLIIDDPFKNREEAESESRRDLVEDWYNSSARTRLRPNAAVIIFHTRWHVDDLAGRLMRKMVSDPKASQWEIVCLPALALDSYPTPEQQRERMRDGVYLPLADPLGRMPGASLCPEWYPVEWLESTKADVGPYDFEALYQQNPFNREGNMFRREWFTVVDNLPTDVVDRVMFWDKAATAGGGDYTAGVRLSVDKDGFYYVEQVVRGQWSAGERDRTIVSTAKDGYELVGPFVVWHQQDPGSAGKDSAQATNATLAEAGLTGRFEPVTGDKVVRAGPLSSAAQAGRVRIVRGGWNQAFLDELTAFPKGRYDDQVDAASTAFNKVRTGRVRKEVKSYQG